MSLSYFASPKWHRQSCLCSDDLSSNVRAQITDGLTKTRALRSSTDAYKPLLACPSPTSQSQIPASPSPSLQKYPPHSDTAPTPSNRTFTAPAVASPRRAIAYVANRPTAPQTILPHAAKETPRPEP